MALACMVASGTGSLMFIDNVPAKSRMNSEVYRSIRSSQIQLNAKLKRQHNSGQMDYQNILQKQLKVGYSSVTMSLNAPNRWPCTASSGRKYKVGRCLWILDPRIFFYHPCNAEGSHTYRLIKAFVSFSRKHLEDPQNFW